MSFSSKHLDEVILNTVSHIFEVLRTEQIFAFAGIFTQIGREIVVQTQILSKLFTRLCRDHVSEPLIIETFNKIDRLCPQVTIWSEIFTFFTSQSRIYVNERLIEASKQMEAIGLRIYLLATLTPLLETTQQQHMLNDIISLYNNSERDGLASEGLAVSLLKVGRKKTR